MAEKRIPNYIKKDINYNPRDILSAQEYNAILNLLIAQGDYNSSWLEYLQNDAIPEAIEELSVEQITEAITTVVRQEIDALAASVINKTSAQLNNPMVSILNVGQQASGITALYTLLSNKALKATYAIATNLVGTTAAYPTLNQLNTLKEDGNDIVAYSTDGTTVTVDTVETVVSAAHTYVDINEFNSDVFVYPNGNSNTTVRDTVCGIFKYAVNMLNNDAITPDGVTVNAPSSILGNIAVIKYDSTVDVDDIKDIIDDVVQHNKYMILQIDTSSENYDSEGLETILIYMLTKSSIVYPESISSAMGMIHDTISNTISVLKSAVQVLQSAVQTLQNNLDGITITEVDNVKYLNW